VSRQWKSKYGGLELSEAQRLKQPSRELPKKSSGTSAKHFRRLTGASASSYVSLTTNQFPVFFFKIADLRFN
jgi:hypothetical protein